MTGGLLTDMLHHLDVPSDARLISVTAATDPADGATVWTVQYKAAPAPQNASHQREAAIQACRSTHHLPSVPSLGSLPISRSGYSRPASPHHSAAILGLPSPTGAHEGAISMGIPPPRSDIPSSLTFPMLHSLGITPPESGKLMRCFQLKCIVQTYAWGKIGLNSAVARIAFAEGSLNDDLELEESSPYAELWMGTHPSGPSMVVLEQPWKTITPLSEWLKLNPELGGSKVRRRSASAGQKAPVSLHAFFLVGVDPLALVRGARIHTHPVLPPRVAPPTHPRLRAPLSSRRAEPEQPQGAQGLGALFAQGALRAHGALDPGAPGQGSCAGAPRQARRPLQGRQP